MLRGGVGRLNSKIRLAWVPSMQQDKAWLTFKFAEGQTASPVPLLPAGQRKFAARSLLRVTVQGTMYDRTVRWFLGIDSLFRLEQWSHILFKLFFRHPRLQTSSHARSSCLTIETQYSNSKHMNSVCATLALRNAATMQLDAFHGVLLDLREHVRRTDMLWR
jgi:hypothetical protein